MTGSHNDINMPQRSLVFARLLKAKLQSATISGMPAEFADFLSMHQEICDGEAHVQLNTI